MKILKIFKKRKSKDKDVFTFVVYDTGYLNKKNTHWKFAGAVSLDKDVSEMLQFALDMEKDSIQIMHDSSLSVME